MGVLLEKRNKPPEVYRWRSLVFRSRCRGLPFDLSVEDVGQLMKLPCHYCGTAKAGDIDRYDNRLGYTVANCVSACAPCNRRKQTKSALDFLLINKQR